MSTIPHTDLTMLFAGPGTYTPATGEPIRTSHAPAGTLRVRGGQIVVFDPLSAWEKEPLEAHVPPGDYPVQLALAHFGDDVRVAAAWVRLGAGPVVRWEMATRAGEDVATLKPNGFFGFGVDAGTAAVADVQAAAAQDHDAIDALSARMDVAYADTWSAAEAPGTPNLVAFSSGFGDGSYASWWGFDATGARVALVVDFDLLSEPQFALVTIPGMAVLPLGPVESAALAAHGITVARIPALRQLETPGPTFQIEGAQVEVDVVDPGGAPILVDRAHAGPVFAFTGPERTALPLDAGLRIQVFLGRAQMPRQG